MGTSVEQTPGSPRPRPFESGDSIVLFDRRRRRYRVRLQTGASYFSHLGSISHDELIGREEGCFVYTNRGHRLLALRPTFREAIQDLPRQSQVIYPKDLAAILMHANIAPGARVAELGLGSGALSAAILRAIGPAGTLTTYEVRQEIVDAAAKNIAGLVTDTGNHTIVVADVYEHGIQEEELDVVIADLPQPWKMIEASAGGLRLGGIFLSYLPTILQVHQLVMGLTNDQRWQLVETVELLERPWHVTDQSVRPEHRMVAHTGFLTTARRCEVRLPGPPETAGEPEAMEQEDIG